jgi:hypothetical protein
MSATTAPGAAEDPVFVICCAFIGIAAATG